MPTAHVVITKQATYLGQPERWSNGYNFQLGTNELDEAFAADLAHAVRDMEQTVHASTVRFVYSVVGLKDTPAIWSEELGGSGPVGGLTPVTMHPEATVMAESRLKNRVYLRKFFHTYAHLGTSASQPDLLQTTDKASIDTQLAPLTDGSLPGAVKACFPNGDLALVPFTADTYIRSHQFRRRGRRPTP